MENERQGIRVKSSREEILRLFQENEKRDRRQMDERVQHESSMFQVFEKRTCRIGEIQGC